jgi:hypothetical protein
MNSVNSFDLKMEDLTTGNTTVENNKGVRYGALSSLQANT